MRDLERLQDVVEYRVSPGQLRLIFLGVLAVTCAIFAVGVSVGKRIEPASMVAAVDPLSELERAAQSEASSAEEEEEEEEPQLTYHNELTERQRSGQREDSSPSSNGEGQPQGSSTGRTEEASGATPSPAPDTRVQTEPARPEQPSPGESSVFTLQVASFETREEAQEFIADLRSRGHPVFLVRTSTPERGTWYRIRVGPFQNRRQATQYQSRFERVERLPTFLVQRRRG